MCWWVMITSSRSSIRWPSDSSCRSSSSRALPEFGPESISVSGSSSSRYVLTRPTWNGVGMRSTLMPASEIRCQTSGGTSSPTNQRQDLVPLRLHVLAGYERLEVEAKQRLGVRGADVEVPVRVVDRDAVEVADLRLRVAPLDLIHLRLLIVHLGVDLAGDEVLGAELVDQVGERATLARDQLEHEQGGHRSRVRAVEVAEVVVTGDLAAEDGAGL